MYQQPNFYRRTLLGVAVASTLVGCRTAAKMVDSVVAAPTSTPLVIDAHMHVLNHRDASEANFADRHFIADQNIVARVMTKGAVAIGTTIANFATMTAEEETTWLRGLWKQKLLRDDLSFRNIVDGKQIGFKHDRNERYTGFFSNRSRNASLAMGLFPDVDLFMTAMVDFYEGRCTNYTSISDQIDFYETLHTVTRGRFVPLVSFNPTRHVESLDDSNYSCIAKNRFPKLSYLDVVKGAVLARGFAGVKLHPSTGFSPIENFQRGCKNEGSWSAGNYATDDERAHANAIDDAMKQLFVFCARYDVPLLVHSGDSHLSHVNYCAAEKQPNQIDNWRTLMENWHAWSGDQNLPFPRICFAHLAGGFEHENGEVRPAKWLQQFLSWLDTSTRPIFIDLSYMPSLVNDDKKTQAEAALLKSLLQQHPKLQDALVYGSDWHMPGVARKGSAYFNLLDHFDPALRLKIQGQNAKRLYGLYKGSLNLRRLEDFYAAAGIAKSEVRWLSKI